MAGSTSSASISARRAYIRTVSQPTKRHYGTVHLPSLVLQTSQDDIIKGVPRHRFLFGATNASDAQLLESLISKSSRTPSDETEMRGGKYYAKYLSRSDLELRISKSRASTAMGQKLLRRCKDEGIPAVIRGENDEECDEIMLQESDYLIDYLSHELCYSHDWWLNNHARTGIPQDNLLTTESFDKSRLMMWDRLCSRYCGFGWKASSGGYHGNGTWYGCHLCGGNCKRRKCRGLGIPQRIKERKKYEEQKEKWREDELKELQPDKWRSLTARDLTYWIGRCNEGRMPHSIDTFSGE